MNQRIGIWGDGAPHIKQYAQHVGAFVVNFGFLEYVSYLWITCLQHDTALIDAAADMPLGQRLTLVTKLAERGIAGPQKEEALELWKQVRRLTELRNAVCHNPYIYGWSSGKEEGDPDFACTPRIKEALKKKSGAMPGRKEIEAGIEATGRIGNRLFGLILSYAEELAEGSGRGHV
jgi:hypothetical protein